MLEESNWTSFRCSLQLVLVSRFLLDLREADTVELPSDLEITSRFSTVRFHAITKNIVADMGKPLIHEYYEHQLDAGWDEGSGI